MIEGWKRKRETGRRMKGGEECVAHGVLLPGFRGAASLASASNKLAVAVDGASG